MIGIPMGYVLAVLLGVLGLLLGTAHNPVVKTLGIVPLLLAWMVVLANGAQRATEGLLSAPEMVAVGIVGLVPVVLLVVRYINGLRHGGGGLVSHN